MPKKCFCILLLEQLICHTTVFLQVLDEVKYYTNATEAKINSISKMQCNLRLPYNPKPDSSSTECFD